jgi:hypothetical protein
MLLRLVVPPAPARSCGLIFSTLNFAARSRIVLNTSSIGGGSPLIQRSGLMRGNGSARWAEWQITIILYNESAVNHEGGLMANLENALLPLRAERREAQLHVEKLDQAIAVVFLGASIPSRT